MSVVRYSLIQLIELWQRRMSKIAKSFEMAARGLEQFLLYKLLHHRAPKDLINKMLDLFMALASLFAKLELLHTILHCPQWFLIVVFLCLNGSLLTHKHSGIFVLVPGFSDLT